MDYETGKWLEQLQGQINGIIAVLKEKGLLEAENKEGEKHE